MNTRLAFILIVVGAASCACDDGNRTMPLPEPLTDSTPMLARVAAEYTTWRRVDEWNHWAPELCRIKPSVARISASADETTHGQKLYYLYAKDRAAYMASAAQDQPIGQVIVKESWIPVEVGALEAAAPSTPGGHTFAERAGRLWKPGEKSALFVMMKVGPDVSGTDAGWVYATTSPDGARVHESGRIQSCMSCHVEGTRDRMFGLKE